MAADRSDEIIALLDEAAQAHRRYEQTQLHGAADENWARWYAAYLVEQGISASLGHAVNINALRDFLITARAEFNQASSSEAWTAYLARRIQHEL